MVVIREPGEIFLLCHGGGDNAVSWLERIDADTLEATVRSVDLLGGKGWPGGVAAHANGSLYVVFGRFAHRLSPELSVLGSRELPRDRPYNSFVILSDGSIATKDFGGARPGDDSSFLSDDTEVVILEPESLEIVARCRLPEASIARLSALDDVLYVVGSESLYRLRYDPQQVSLELDHEFTATYRSAGEGYGWDPVLADGAAWFLNNGQGSERYNGSLRGLGLATQSEEVLRVDLATREIVRFEICDRPGAVVANPPAVDVERSIVVGYDTGNGVVTAWNYACTPATQLWSIDLNHGAHPILLERSGVVVLCDFDVEKSQEDIVGINLESGAEVFRVTSGSPVQSMLFGAVSEANEIYFCSFLALTKITFDSESQFNR
jgi:hypothetical protein